MGGSPQRASNVSIAIPVFNECAYIEKTLYSVVGQAEEIIISDNASTDGTSEICEAFAKKFPEVRYIRHEKNNGSVFNWTYAINAATQDYFMWVGGHDLIPQRHVIKLKQALQEKNAVLAYTNAAHFNSDYVLSSVYSYDFADLLMHDNAAMRVFTIIDQLSECSMYHGLYKKDVLQQAIKNTTYDKYVGIDHGQLAEIAFLGKMYRCEDSMYYRIDPRPPMTDAFTKWKRVMQALLAEEYDPKVHLPEFVAIGIYYVQLNTAKKAANQARSAEEYMNAVKQRLLERWGMNDMIRMYIKLNFKD